MCFKVFFEIRQQKKAMVVQTRVQPLCSEASSAGTKQCHTATAFTHTQAAWSPGVTEGQGQQCAPVSSMCPPTDTGTPQPARSCHSFMAAHEVTPLLPLLCALLVPQPGASLGSPPPWGLFSTSPGAEDLQTQRSGLVCLL